MSGYRMRRRRRVALGVGREIEHPIAASKLAIFGESLSQVLEETSPMDGSHSLLFRPDSSLALRCRKGAIHPIIRSPRRWPEQLVRHGEAEHPGGLVVDDKLEL
jgi:hypothetical protein